MTGASGFIGSELVRQIVAKGGHVLCVVRNPGADVHQTLCVDLCEPGALDAHLTSGDIIYHMAGRADVGASLRDPQADFNLNLAVTVNVLLSAYRANCRVVLASTGSVYDPAAKSPIRERAQVGPVSPYGAAKASAEIHALAYHRAYRLDARIVRLFSVFGPGMGQQAISDFYKRLMLNPKCLKIRGDGGQVRDYLYVADAATALHLVGERGEPGEIYNAGTGTGRSIADVARSVAAAAGLPDCEIAPDGIAQSGELYEMVADTSRLATLGFQPRTSFESGLAETVAWLADR